MGGGLKHFRFHTNGNLTITGTLADGSDRDAKENLADIDPADLLEKVVSLPISRWNFKTDPGVDHIGPMAQDFHAAFQVGMDDKHIATVDADGVALAAIQGLNRKLEAQVRELERQLKVRDQALEIVQHSVAQLRDLMLPPGREGLNRPALPDHDKPLASRGGSEVRP